MAESKTGAESYSLGDLRLQSGEVLREARLEYKTYGSLDATRSNAILVPAAYGGSHVDNEWLIAEGRAFDPARWFVVATNLFGGGLSTSPSNASDGQRGAAFPRVSIYDNVFAQHRLVTDVFGLTRVALVSGFSMGGIQAYHWACAFPGIVERIAPICAAAKTANHTLVYLDGMERLMRLPLPDDEMKETVGRAWAAWGFSQTFWREERWDVLGANSRDEAVRLYADGFAPLDRYDMLALLRSWREADVGALERYGGNWRRALAAIDARAAVMPCRTDCYFPPEDNAREVALMGDAELVTIESCFGHAAGANVNPADSAFIDEHLKRLLERERKR